MSTESVVGERGTVTHGRVPDWAEPEGQAEPDPRRGVLRGVSFRVVTGGLVALGLAWVGHALPAALLLVVVVVSAALALGVRSVGEAMERALARFQAAVGRGLALLLFGLVFGVVFLPASLVLRLTRRDPLALGGRVPRASSQWREAPRPTGRRARALLRRPYGLERHPDVAVRGGRIRAAFGVVLILLMVDYTVGALLLFETEPVSFGGPGLADRAAAAGEPWVDEVAGAFDDMTNTLEYDPFLGLRHGDISGEHMNVTNGVRDSYVANSGNGDDVEVWFFGGSTMLGGYQRDGHTIPSELVRLAEASGITLRAFNFGRPAYGIWQEKYLLEEQLAAGERPDLVVFYDGGNDTFMQMELPEASDTPTHLWARSMEWDLDNAVTDPEDDMGLGAITDAYLARSASAELWRRWRGKPAGLPTEGGAGQPWPNQTVRTAERGQTIARHHAAAVDVIGALSEGYGFDVAFFWQPWGPTMDDIAQGDEHIVHWLWTDRKAWQEVTEASRQALHPSVIDIADSLDGTGEPVMYDLVHTNEAGARIVAEAMYQQLEPALHRVQEKPQP